MSPPKNEPNFAMNQTVQDYYTHSYTLFRQSLLSLMHNAAMRDILPSRPVDYLVTTLGERVSFRIRVDNIATNMQNHTLYYAIRTTKPPPGFSRRQSSVERAIHPRSLRQSLREVVLGIIFILILFRAIDPELNGNWLALFQRDQGTCTRIVCSKTNRMSAIANWAVEAEEDLTMVVDVLRSVAAQNVPLEGYF
ncbi:hypothetical protein BDV27DRAFT_153206 [Aspergillus caelatus]|uniref:Uncharacterized protein n=1 Tax=Aspergillus caelatus TaxID=61420 RepID=A0A5N7AKU3_9EURO|nr:uncharacterized protein BDV27DRAFT_153206 [Aspergillus caelatus]KAE8369330.1 hypothetical protein BDV27DRAFT_153206 [Aspergillus caelatus]